MKKRLIFVAILALFVAAVPGRALAAVEVGNDPACTELQDADPETLKAAGCPVGEDKEIKVGEVVQNIINVVIAVLGIVAVLFVIIGAVGYTTSQGDPSKTKKAKDTILYAILGVILAVLAYTIVNFVLANVFSDKAGQSQGENTSQEAKE